ncbi:hypothetical protein GP486_000300 [Trichoglossum hirsutum]|uniref:DUF6594 domain-containing protein n=1 Tax=Trichoglossum hirsutum TaxID=265104 RepID=A0A9P8LJ21_9PEZI|nr:hypothetical protein GP486_000300 [Trichoglossum hirsutum]
MKALLHMQAELTILESQYESIVEEDIESGKHERLSVYRMRRESNIQWRTAKEARKLLKEYHQLSKLKCVDDKHYQALQKYLRIPEGVNNFLGGREANPWSEKNRSDLVTLSSQHAEEDLLTRWVFGTLFYWLHEHLLRRIKNPVNREKTMFGYPDEVVLAVADFLAAAISGLLPVLSIVTLYLLKNPVAKIGAIISLDIIFVLALIVTTKCRRVELFAATVAFSAVQVVFLATTSYAVPAPTSS